MFLNNTDSSHNYFSHTRSSVCKHTHTLCKCIYILHIYIYYIFVYMYECVYHFCKQKVPSSVICFQFSPEACLECLWLLEDYYLAWMLRCWWQKKVSSHRKFGLNTFIWPVLAWNSRQDSDNDDDQLQAFCCVSE